MAFDLHSGIEGKSVLLTGGAGGIGREIAFAFDAAGARVAVIEGVRRAALTAVTLRAANVKEQDVPAAVRETALRNPYDDHALEWNETLRAIVFHGLGPDDRFQRFSLGLGVGGHIPLGSRFWVDVDAVGSQVLSTDSPFSSKSNNLLTQARAMLGFQVMPRLAVFGGPTYNAWFTWGEPGFAKLTTLSVKSHSGTDSRVQHWPGFQLGVRI